MAVPLTYSQSLLTVPSLNESGDRLLHSASYLIREARPDDLPILTDILADSFHRRDGVEGFLYPCFRMGIYEDLRHRFQLKAPHQVCLVAVSQTPTTSNQSHADQILGTVEIAFREPGFWQPRTTRYLYVFNLAVHTQFRRQGIAQQLLKSCEQVAKNWGFNELYLHVLENNQQAQNLYHKMGYRLRNMDFSLTSWLFGTPRQMFLQKQIR
jgi:ribosomal protein S18 acetylase RimI-like enzyme